MKDSVQKKLRCCSFVLFAFDFAARGQIVPDVRLCMTAPKHAAQFVCKGDQASFDKNEFLRSSYRAAPACDINARSFFVCRPISLKNSGELSAKADRRACRLLALRTFERQ